MKSIRCLHLSLLVVVATRVYVDLELPVSFDLLREKAVGLETVYSIPMVGRHPTNSVCKAEFNIYFALGM